MRPLIVWCFLLALVLPQAVIPTSQAKNASAVTAADTTGSIVVNGQTRHFVYSVSSQAAPAGGRPLVIFLHGDGGTPNLSAAWKDAVLNDSNGAVLLAAEGRNNIPAAAAIDGSAWRFRMDESGQPYDDTDFINELITQATASSALLGTAINSQQVYVVGESRGAGFAFYLYADPRTRNKIRAIVPISGTFYCDGDADNGNPAPGSDTTCGEVSEFGYWTPKASLFTGATRPTHILDIHGQLPPNGGELEETAPPALDVDYGSSTWTGWGDAAGCYTVRVSSQTEQTLPKQVGGRTVKSYAYSQSENNLAAHCNSLDLTFYIAQGGGHVPGGFEPTAWCYLSTIGGNASAHACGTTPPVNNDVSLSVNAANGRQPISEDIYGLHEADEAFAAEIGLPVRRYGGNLATRYNWQTNTTNSGLDYYFSNRPADISADDFVARDRRTGTKSILTMPMTGWVSKNDDYATCGFDVNTYNYTPKDFGSSPGINPDHPNCGTGIVNFTADGDPIFLTGVDPQDTSVAFGPTEAAAWIAHLKSSFGAAAQGGVPYYSLDNEPDLWSETHADLVPIAKKYQEYRDTSISFASAIKQADPGAQTLGPALGSYSYFFNSFYDGHLGHWTDDTATDRMANGGTPFLAWYLQQMKQYQTDHGTRLLDYLDVHWYPQHGEYQSPAGDAAMQATRLDSVRGLWDTSYADPFWASIGSPDGGVTKLIPRLHDLVNANYPGTKIAISEYSWGAHADLNGALAQADILGVFGREGVDLATLFDGRYESEDSRFAPDRPSAYAFRMYRNYDGQGHRFGNTRVDSSSSDQGKLSIYAAQRSSDGALTLIVINKTKGSLSSAIALNGFTPTGAASVYRYSAANLAAISHEADVAVAGNSLQASFPAESITMLVLPGGGGAQNKVFIPTAQR